MRFDDQSQYYDFQGVCDFSLEGRSLSLCKLQADAWAVTESDHPQDTFNRPVVTSRLPSCSFPDFFSIIIMSFVFRHRLSSVFSFGSCVLFGSF
jgi:hypothetical protein